MFSSGETSLSRGEEAERDDGEDLRGVLETCVTTFFLPPPFVFLSACSLFAAFFAFGPILWLLTGLVVVREGDKDKGKVQKQNQTRKHDFIDSVCNYR